MVIFVLTSDSIWPQWAISKSGIESCYFNLGISIHIYNYSVGQYFHWATGISKSGIESSRDLGISIQIYNYSAV